MRNRADLDTGQTWINNSQDTGVFQALNFLLFEFSIFLLPHNAPVCPSYLQVGHDSFTTALSA